MNYSEDYISNFGKQTGFINSNIEKVIRLLDILVFINSDLDPYHESSDEHGYDYSYVWCR